MFHLSSSLCLSLRFLSTRIATTDPLLNQLKNATNKYRIFQLIGVHRHALTLEHATCAINSLCKIHKENPKTLSDDPIQEHPEFLSLCSIVENNINFMDDRKLVNILSTFHSFQEDARSSIMQRLVSEGWRRLQRLDLPSLSKFAACLKRQDLSTSPLMGQIANIVDGCLDNIEDPVVITNFTISLYAVSSPHLWQRLIQKTDSTLEKLNASHYDNILQLMEIFWKKVSNFNDFTLMKKCDRLLYKHAGAFDLQTIYIILRTYPFIRSLRHEFCVVLKAKLMEDIDRCDHPDCFVILFVALAPSVSLKMRKRLENKLLNMEDNNMSVNDLYDVLKTMKYTACQNTALIHKICSSLQKHLWACPLYQLSKITELVVFLNYQGYSIRRDLQMLLKRHILSSFIPSEVARSLRALFLLNSSQVNDATLFKIPDIIAQSNFESLSYMTFVVTQLLQSTDMHHSTDLTNLHEELCSHKLERVNGAKCLDFLLNEFQHTVITNKIDEALVEPTLQAFQRLSHQVNGNNVALLSGTLLRLNIVCNPLLESIASVTLDNLHKIPPDHISSIVAVFCRQNFKPSQGDDFFNACSQLLVKNMDSLSPYYLVQTAFYLAVGGYFPKEVINAIFNTDFLLRFDTQVDAFHNNWTANFRYYLMSLNRAVCIERPEYGVPWFHEQYCKEVLPRVQRPSDPKMQLMLEEIFGGPNYAKILVTSPYHYSIAVEYILDKEGNPIAYVEENALSPGSSSVFEPDSQLEENKPLPTGAQRIAVDFLLFDSLLRNTDHVRGFAAMKKRHLEILGYRVVQIPYSEWNGSKDIQKWLPGNFTSRKI